MEVAVAGATGATRPCITQMALRAAATLHPAYFALVMATGIVSLAAYCFGLTWIAFGLLGINLAFYAALWLLTIVRVARFGGAVVRDFRDHGRGVGFFTLPAATAVLGSQVLLLTGNVAGARILEGCALGLWLLIVYGALAGLIVKPAKPSLAQGINGGWLVCAVATQSIAVLATQLAPSFEPPLREAAYFAAVSFWLAGGMLYLWVISLLFYRYLFFALDPAEFASPNWIAMGAVAIATLAGATLSLAAANSPLLASLLPFLKGLTLLWWATATWWIPLLLALGFWRYFWCSVPLRYEPLHWGGVFPLGMYTVCTLQLGKALTLPFLERIAAACLYVALTAWFLAFFGMVLHLLRQMRPRNAADPGVNT